MTTRLAMRGQLAFMREHGLEVTAVASPGWDLDEAGRQEGVPTFGIHIERELSPLRDAISLLRLFVLFRKLRPHIVHSGTPKASLLSMFAARLARVPVRVYAVKGLRLETTIGWKRRMLRWTERISSACANRVFCEGPELARVYAQLGLACPEKLVVFGSGMLNGLDAARFHPQRFSATENDALRQSLGIAADRPVIGFVGRFVRDKGLIELVAAFEEILRARPRARLLLVGEFERGDPLPTALVERMQSHPRITLTGFVADTAPYYPLMDVLALPSYREGFPNAPMEAAAAGIPTVGFASTGMGDAVLDGHTGALTPCGDAQALARAIERYLDDEELRRAHGAAAQRRVETEFAPEPIWEAIFAEYARLLAAAGIEAPGAKQRESVGAAS